MIEISWIGQRMVFELPVPEAAPREQCHQTGESIEQRLRWRELLRALTEKLERDEHGIESFERVTRLGLAVRLQ